MDALAQAAARLRRFGAQMNPDVPRIDRALPALRALLESAGVPYKLVGGIAVIHHGYERLTVDLDVIVSGQGLDAFESHLAAFDFERVADHRLRHTPSGVRVDVLTAGTSMRGPRGPVTIPAPSALTSSPRAADVVSLPGLIALKLDLAAFGEALPSRMPWILADLAPRQPLELQGAVRRVGATRPRPTSGSPARSEFPRTLLGRRQDLADVGRLLKGLDEGDYLATEAAVPAAHRAELLMLREEALQERAWEPEP